MPSGTRSANTFEDLLTHFSESHEVSVYEAIERLVQAGETVGFDAHGLLGRLDHGMTFEDLSNSSNRKCNVWKRHCRRLPDETSGRDYCIVRYLMSCLEWSRSSVDYSRGLVDSAFEGARDRGRRISRRGSAGSPPREVCPAGAGSPVIGACLGLLGTHLGNRPRSTTRAPGHGFLGGRSVLAQA